MKFFKRKSIKESKIQQMGKWYKWWLKILISNKLKQNIKGGCSGKFYSSVQISKFG